MKNNFNLFILFITCSLVTSAQRINYNPIIPDNLADPTIMQFGDTFYLYATSDVGDLKTDLSFSGNPVIWKSKDFVNWSFEGISFPEIDWRKYKYWAPGRVIKKEGRYYLFVTVEGSTRLAISESPEGPFRFMNGPVNYPSIESTVVNDIDGCPFIDDDGKAYLFWRNRKAAQLTADFQKTEGEIITIPTRRQGYSEGPFMFKRKGIYYYFYTMSGYCDYQYGYIMSRTSPLGPFETAKKDVVLSTNLKENIWGPGHGFAFNFNKSDKWIFVYLEYGSGGTSRQVYANRMKFKADGSIKPLKINRKGVGPLVKSVHPKPIDLRKAKATASSIREPLVVEARRGGNQKDLFALLPEKLPTRKHTFEAQNAFDKSNFTEWRANLNDSLKWWQIDLVKMRKIDFCEIFFAHPTLGHSFLVEKSLDGKNWITVQEEKTSVIRSPHIAKGVGSTRFIRIKIKEGTPGIWEVNFY